MLSITIPQCYAVTKNYDIKITKFKGSIYGGDTEWIAEWFYTQYQPFADNVIFHIRGDFHVTYPNPPHLSVKIEYPDGALSEWLHISVDEYGKGYIQDMAIAGQKKSSIKTQKSRKQRKQRKTEKKSRQRRKGKKGKKGKKTRIKK